MNDPATNVHSQREQSGNDGGGHEGSGRLLVAKRMGKSAMHSWSTSIRSNVATTGAPRSVGQAERVLGTALGIELSKRGDVGVFWLEGRGEDESPRGCTI